jgi:two-component system OmpR family sensor kinase
VVTNFSGTRAVLASLRLVVLLLLTGMFVVGVLIGGPLVSQSLRPLRVLTQAAHGIATGDLSQRARIPHDGEEIGQLADAFDEMATRIEAAFAVQTRSEEQMRQFIADASHELRTPLTAIRGYTDVLLRGAAQNDPAAAREVLLATKREAERMSRLVSDLLTLARLDTGRPLERQPVDLIAVVGEAVDQTRITAGSREVSLTTDGGGRLMIMGDADRLKQVLLILLDNALKYGRPAPEGWVRVRVRRTAGGAEVVVADNGRGIAPDDLPRIFDRFHRGGSPPQGGQIVGAEVSVLPTAPPVPESANGPDNSPRGPSHAPTGSGLGLAIAKAIAQAHGGTLSVESQVGVGTTFSLALPRA